MKHVVKYWLPSGIRRKEPFNTAEAAFERYRNLLQQGHKYLKLYIQHASDTDER